MSRIPQITKLTTHTMTQGPLCWFDHFVVGIDDLETGATAFSQATGVGPEPGGEHPHLGTHNALVSLGEASYLEILAPRPGADVSPLFAAVAGKTSLTPVMWAVATDDIETAANRLRDAGFDAPIPEPGSRTTRSGEAIRWNMFMLGKGGPVAAPFVIEWDPDTRHPATTTPTGCTLETFTVTTPDARRLRTLLSLLEIDVEVSEGPFSIVIDLRTPGGFMRLGGGGITE